MTKAAADSAKIIQQYCPHFTPKLTIVLGSGLGKLADQIENATIISYSDLPGFYKPTVAGHAGNLYCGSLHGVPVACMQGRAHFYEGVNNQTMQTMVRAMKLIGSNIWLATNAAGSMRSAVLPGSLVVIKDHINLQFTNPLIGEKDDYFGERFVPLEDAYDPAFRQQLSTLAKRLKIELTEGVYMAVSGPSFETPSEINAFRLLGGDVVGMSTVPEVILARHCGMRVLVISAITNMAVGMTADKVTHDETLRGAQLASEKLIALVSAFVESLR